MSCERSQNKTFTIGVIVPNSAYNKIIDGLKSEIEKGDLKGRVSFIIQDFPKTAEEYDAACNILLKMKPDLVYVLTTPVAISAKKCIKDIPILFNAVGDPVGAGIVKDPKKPDGNITGFSNFSRELAAKRLEIFKEAFPKIKNVLTFYNPTNQFSVLAIKDLEKAAYLLKLNIIQITGKDSDEIRREMKKIKMKSIDGIYLMPDAVALSMFSEVLEISKQHQLPVMAHESGLVERGATISYGADFFELGRLSYVYVRAILNGESAGKLPVFFPDKFLLTVNKKMANQLNLKIPEETLFFADRIIND
ncbi:MAG: hypothetical protein OHK0040_05530 [bacterium]